MEQLNKLGYKIKNVHELNLIMEEMGLIEHVGNSWLTTDKGLEYSMIKVRAYDVKEWHASLIRAVSEFLWKTDRRPL